jgi:hypothetical protein
LRTACSLLQQLDEKLGRRLFVRKLRSGGARVVLVNRRVTPYRAAVLNAL